MAASATHAPEHEKTGRDLWRWIFGGLSLVYSADQSIWHSCALKRKEQHCRHDARKVDITDILLF